MLAVCSVHQNECCTQGSCTSAPIASYFSKKKSRSFKTLGLFTWDFTSNGKQATKISDFPPNQLPPNISKKFGSEWNLYMYVCSCKKLYCYNYQIVICSNVKTNNKSIEKKDWRLFPSIFMANNSNDFLLPLGKIPMLPQENHGYRADFWRLSPQLRNTICTFSSFFFCNAGLSGGWIVRHKRCLGEEWWMEG